MDKYIGSIKRFINKQNTKDFLLNHKNTLIVIVAIILLGGITTIISYAYFSIVANQTVVKGQVGTITNINMYYFVEDKNASTGAGLGTYSKSVYVPRTTYTYNSSLSYCKHGSTLSYNATTYTFTVSNTKDACYAYFDVSESKNADIVLNIYMQKNGEYKLVNEVPSEYYIDTTQSSCTNGATMSLDNGEILVNTTNKTVCNAYLNPPLYWHTTGYYYVYSYPLGQRQSRADYNNNLNNWENINIKTYGSLESLKNNTTLENVPIFIKTTTEHHVCMYYNNRGFCLGLNYWDTDITTTLNKMQSEMESALDTSDIQCSAVGDSTGVKCQVSNIHFCIAYSDGTAYCVHTPQSLRVEYTINTDGVLDAYSR